MSVSELEAHIEGISAEIERQKEVLRALERRKSHAQRQLNALRDPLARLPLEISSEIFLHCLSARPSPGKHHCPTLFLTICHAWSDIALSLPTLWTRISIDFSEAEGRETTVVNWLDRARGHLLDVSLLGRTNDQMAALIWQHSGRLQSLDIDFEHVDVDKHVHGEDYWPLGDSGPLEPLPFLHTSHSWPILSLLLLAPFS